MEWKVVGYWKFPPISFRWGLYTNVHGRIFALLDRVNQVVLEATPRDSRVSPIDMVITAMQWRCVCRYNAIVLLLKNYYPDEAGIVMRSLMNDAQRLIYLDRNPKKRTATVMWLWNKRLSNIENLARAAEKMKQPGSEADLLNYVKKGRADLERAKLRFGVGKFNKPPDEGASIATNLNRADDWLDYLMTTYTSHGTLLGVGFHIRELEPGTRQLSLTDSDPGLLFGVGCNASEYIVESTWAVASMLKWDSKPALQTMWDSVQLQFEALNQIIEGHAK